MPSVIGSGLAASTTNKYSAGWKYWVEWCKSNREISVIPATPFTVALYLVHVLESKNKTGPLISAFYGIRWGHIISGFPSPTDDPFVKLAFEGCQRLCDSHRNGPKEPIPVELLKQFYNQLYDLNNLKHLRFLTMVFLGFTGFLRIDELLLTQMKHVKFYENRLEIRLEKSKCDQHRDGETVYISRLNSKYCPVKLLEEFLEKCKVTAGNNSEFFIIPRIFATKKGYKISLTDGISYTRAREIFVEKIKEFKYNPQNFGLHSLRSGGASAASENLPATETSERLISKHGRWKGDISKNRYIKDTIKKRMIITKSLGL